MVTLRGQICMWRKVEGMCNTWGSDVSGERRKVGGGGGGGGHVCMIDDFVFIRRSSVHFVFSPWSKTCMCTVNSTSCASLTEP